MGAISPYAPTGRNVFLKLLPEQASTPLRIQPRPALTCVALMLFVIKYWSTPQFRSLRELCKLQRILCSSVVGGLLETTVGTLVKREFNRLRNVVAGTIKVWNHLLTDVVAIPTTQTAQSFIRSLLPSTKSKVTNQQMIQTVLHYWFGQYTPEEAQKKLWMIANSSVEQRRKVDADIGDKFESIVLKLSEGLWENWCDEIYSYYGKLAAIVCLDQFSRHIQRHYSEHAMSPLPPQSTMDHLAYHIAQLLFEKHESEIASGMVPLPMYIFGIMPYRHASTTTSVAFVQCHIATMAEMQVQLDGMTRRFRKATNRRMAVLQDESRRTGTEQKLEFLDEDILETVAFKVDMKHAINHVVYTTISNFLKELGVTPLSETSVPVIVSLSGGVDSMVIASVLAHMAETNYNIKVYAIHIDYGNRPESSAEAAFVERYCHQSHINYTCRRIDEVTRGITARDDYERIARDARYHTYRATVKECDVHGNVEIGVMLGHHRGDLRENVLSNAHKGCGPLDLSGMTAVSKNDGVVIYRPLLTLEKDKIFDYAHTYGVPYFKDTTPHWSTRGKLRNKLLPLLEEIYGEGSMNNLSSLAIESDEARTLLHGAILGPFLRKVERLPMGITFETKEWKEQSLFFWKFVLREALHSAGLGMFSDKSVVSFLERVQAGTLKSGWLQCRKDYAVFLREDGRVFALFPTSFPFRKADQFDCVGQRVKYGEDASVGPWLIRATVVEPNGRSAESLLEQKAVVTMEGFMTGDIEYYVKVDKLNPSPLVFVSEYSKASRPHAWKNTDAKLQTTLPLLACDEAVGHVLTDISVVRVEMKLVGSTSS